MWLEEVLFELELVYVLYQDVAAIVLLMAATVMAVLIFMGDRA